MATTLFPLQYLRQGADPIDVDSVFATTAERIAYLANGRRYPGQIVADLEENKVYFLDSAGTSWIEVGSGGGGIPGGLDGQVQYNDGGVFGGSPSFTYDSATSTVGLETISNPGPITVEVTSTPAWYSLYGDLLADVDDDYSSSVVYDSLGNIYSVGADGNTGVPFLLKYSPSGTLLWQKTFTEVNNYYKTGDALTVDSLDNVYCSISVDDAAAVESYIIKLDSSGNIIWQLKLQNFNGTDYTVPPVTDMMVDGSDNLYAIVGVRKLPSSWLSDAVLIKFSSSGVLQWQRKLSTPSVDDSLYPQGIWVDSAGNSHIVMTYTINSPSFAVRTIIVKYTTSGSLVWQNEYDIATVEYDYGYNITGDSVGNIYFTSDSGDMNIIKADSAGSIIWNKQIDSGTYSSGVALDASGNVYVSGGFDGGSPSPKNDYLILKFTSAGSLVWQRSFSGSDSDYTYYYWASRYIDVLGENYVIAGYTYTPSSTSNAEAITVQLKTDGSGTGVYGSFTYGIPTFTESTPAITVQASTLTASVAGLTISAGSLATADLTKTSAYAYMFGGAQTWSFNADGSLSLPGYSIPGGDGVAGALLQTDGAGTGNWTPYGFPLVDGSAGETLITDGAGNVSWQPISVNPGGSDTQVQYNDGGILGGNSALTFDKVTGTLQSTNTTVTDTLDVPYITNASDITVELGSDLLTPVNPWFRLSQFAYGNYAETKRVKFDSSGAIYLASHLDGTSNYDVIVKYDSNGNVLWQVSPINVGYIIDMTIMGGAVYISSEFSLTSISASTGAYLWRIDYEVGSSYFENYLANDGTFIYHIIGNIIYPTYSSVIFKISSVGAIVWQRELPTPVTISSITVDAAGSLILAGNYDYTDTLLIKMDSSGNIVWKYRYTPTALQPDNVSFTVTDSTLNIYNWITTFGVAPTYGAIGILVKYNSSGDLQWAYSFSPVSPTTELEVAYPKGLAIDNNDLIYVYGNAFGNAEYDDSMLLYCINSSGTLQWQKHIFSLTGNIFSYYNDSWASLVDVWPRPGGAPQEIAIAANSYGATLGNTVMDIYTTSFVARLPAVNVAQTIESSGFIYRTPSGTQLISHSLTQVPLTETVSVSTYTSTLYSGTSALVTLESWLGRFGYYSWVFYQNGKTQISSTFLLPQVQGEENSVLTADSWTSGFTEWQLPAVVDRSIDYSWSGKQTFTSGAVTNNLIRPWQTLAVALSGTVNATFIVSDTGVQYYTVPAAGNWSVVFGYSAATNETVTYEIYVTQGATAYYNKDVWIQDTVVSNISWFTERPLSGNPNSVDRYVYNITNTGTGWRVEAGRYKYVPNTLPYPYWVSLISNGVQNIVSDLVLDPSNNVYVLSQTYSSAKYITKLNSSGALEWSTRIQGGVGFSAEGYQKIAIDSSGNTYAVSWTNSSVSAFIIKINSSGAVQWQKQITGFATNPIIIGTNLYIGLRIVSTSYIVRYDTTTGNIDWQRQISSNISVHSLGVDSSNNIYIAGTTTIIKIDTSGSILWQKSYTNQPMYYMVVTPTGNVATFGAGPSINRVVQLINGSTGVPIWASQISGNFTATTATNIAADSSDNIVISSYQYPDARILKLNSSGTVLWNNKFNQFTSMFGLKIGSTGTIYTGGYSGNMYLFKMPADGSGLNVYRWNVNFYNFIVSRDTASSAIISAPQTNTALTLSVSALTDTATTFTVDSITTTSSLMEVIPTS